MSKFVRLTEVLATGEIKSLMVNAEFIVHIQSGMRGKDTHIRMHDAKFYFVKESFDEVQQLINAGSVAQPIIMSEANLKSLQLDPISIARVANGLSQPQ